jgi:hypothetical protein
MGKAGIADPTVASRLIVVQYKPHAEHCIPLHGYVHVFVLLCLAANPSYPMDDRRLGTPRADTGREDS